MGVADGGVHGVGVQKAGGTPARVRLASIAPRFDADGNPIYATPHRPVNPRRQRHPRFAEGPIDIHLR